MFNHLKFKITFYIILSGVLFWECASIKAPPGGLIDETPPQIISISPPSGTVNLIEKKILVEFSEYMDEKSFKNNIVVFPRLESPIKYKFKGDKIYLILPEGMDSTKTYTIQLNRNIKDEHGVSLAISEQLAYSMGNNISQGMISGIVYGGGNKSVHLWKTNSVHNDSIFADLPDYITDTDDSGYYSFEYLAPGSYNILAVNKNSSDLPLNVERTEYGLYWKPDIYLSENDTLTSINMRIWKEPQDLKLVRGEWSAYNWGTIFFNNELSDSISLAVKLQQNGNIIDYIYYLDPTDSKNLIVYSDDSLISKSITLQIDSISYKDSLLLDSAEVEIQIPQEADTSYLQIISPQSGLSIIPKDIDGDQIDLIFSKPVSLSTDTTLVPQLFDKDSINIAISIEQKNLMYFIIKPINYWEENARYRLNINRDGVLTEHGRGLKDSLQTINISTKKSMGYGGVIGTLIGNIPEDIKVELFSAKNPSLSQLSGVNSQSQFEFKMIPEGDYLLNFFKDSNHDMKYNFGIAYQLQPSEWFYFYPDTFEVRANWDTELIPFEFPEIK